MFGFLNVYKPKGKTSHDVVAFFRRVTKIKQIGHTGTLDPFAEGVLPICLGKSTRLIEYLDDDKAYIATVQLGAATTTYDIEGEITKTSNQNITLELIEKELVNFRGNIEQYPPIYSAIKVNGKKLYDYARSGESVEIKPRNVVIYELKIKHYDFEKRILELYIACSKGTYIRSIANDLGENLGIYGHLIKLVRVKAGKFDIDNAMHLEELNEVEYIKANLINPIEYLSYPRYELNEKEKLQVLNGMKIHTESSDGLTLLVQNKKIIAIGETQNAETKCLKVFN